MKVLVVSDVHANIAALNTILEKEADYDILCCAGSSQRTDQKNKRTDG